MADILSGGKLTFKDKDGNSGVVASLNDNDIATLNQALEVLYGLFPVYSTDDNYAVGQFRIYANELYKCVQANGPSTTVVTPGTDEHYWVKVITSDETMGARNIGEIVYSTLPLVDAGLHLADGTLIDGAGVYSEFVDYIADLYDQDNTAAFFTTEVNWQTEVTANGRCGKFVYDSTNNTVRLPKLVGILQGSTDAATLGDYIAAGLPNITGAVSFKASTNATTGNSNLRVIDASGAFSQSTTTSQGSYWSPDGTRTTPYPAIANFSAANSNSIYGNSSSVQPPALKVYVYIVVANTKRTAIAANIDNVVTDLNGKADTDLANVTDAGTSLIAHNAMPEDTQQIDLTPPSSSGVSITYTAPADGYYEYSVRLSDTSRGIQLFTSALGLNIPYTTPGQVVGGYVPVKKGMTVYANYVGTLHATTPNNTLKFIYAIGSAHEAS